MLKKKRLRELTYRNLSAKENAVHEINVITSGFSDFYNKKELRNKASESSVNALVRASLISTKKVHRRNVRDGAQFQCPGSGFSDFYGR